MEYLFVISGVFSALFFLLLVSKKLRNLDHTLLGAIFLLITINSIYVFSFHKEDTFFYLQYFSELNYAIPLLYPPLLWLYTKSVTNISFKLGYKQFLHFAPFIVFLLILISPLVSNYKLIESKHIGYPLIKLVITPFYIIAVLRLLKKYRMRLLNQFSFDRKIKLFWLTWVTVGAAVLWILGLSGYIYNNLNQGHKTLLYDIYVLSFLSLYLFILAFVAFKFTDIFNKKREEDSPVKLEDENVQKELEKKVDLKNDDLNSLIKIMESDKPYLDPLLSINKLAEISKLPQYKISKILNTSLNQNFYDFINTYRVNEVKQRLEDGEAKSFSILGIAIDCGFNSKASFNRVFKKITGTTPTAFIKAIEEK